ncbi:MAG: alpha/beta hydrolase [Myxococcota bacterium]
MRLALRHASGHGTPILFIHGSFEDHHGWAPVVRELGHTVDNPTLVYDRRGHSASTDVDGQGHLAHDVDDAIALLNARCPGAVHVVGHAYGASIAIALAHRSPALVRSAFLYEPPLFGLLGASPRDAALLTGVKAAIARAAGLIRDGALELGTAHFFDRVALGDGAWARLSPATQARMLLNADTWIDQSKDPQRLEIDFLHLVPLGARVSLVSGSASLPTFRRVSRIMHVGLAEAHAVVLAGAGHAAPNSHPRAFAAALAQHLDRNDA